jgi:cyclopropane fatty-acyl-phospholipid synthase-like methyltransferase
MSETELREASAVERYPRSAAYDVRWVVDNLMGPHPLWSVEALMEVMPLEPGMRVLDLGADGGELLGLTRVVANRR